ncbi:MAG: DMT family transporter [Anaerolineae bacterium]
MHNRAPRGLLIALAANMALGLNSAFAKFAYRAGLDPNTLTMLRLGVAALVLWAIFLTRWRALIPIPRRALLGCIIMGAANFVAQISYYWGLTRINASIATLIFYLYPAVVILLLRLRGEAMTTRRLARLGVALIGVALLVDISGGSVDTIGVLLVFVTIFTYSLHLVIGQFVVRDVAARTVVLYVISTMALLATGVRLVMGGSPPPVTWAGWWPVLGIGLLGTVVARLAMFTAIKRVGSTQLALLGVVEPLMTVAVARGFLGETLTPMQWIGGGFVLASLLLVDLPQATVG